MSFFHLFISAMYFMLSDLAMCSVSCVSCRTVSQAGCQITELWAYVSFHTDVAVYARESLMLYCAMMFKCEYLQ
jgi:hypothetical membrane protein